jgi:uncharacterized protein YgbK (DUF1537 family)
MMWDSVYILADDLTGLAETIQAVAEPFSQKQLGYTTTVHPLSLENLPLNLHPFSVIGFNTNHRACPIDTVKTSIVKWVKTVPQHTLESTFIYQKMDSTLRGWWATEAQQWVNAQAVGLVWCCPAYPQQGRTTKNGLHFLNDTPLHQTALATDPTFPIRTHQLTAYLSEADIPKEQILKISVQQIETLSLADWVVHLQKTFQEKRISWILQDATTPEHLEKMATVVHQLKIKNALPTTLFVGSAGWAGALATAKTTAFEKNPRPSPSRGGFETDQLPKLPIRSVGQQPLQSNKLETKLLVSGSSNPVTLDQLSYLKQSNPSKLRWVSVWDADNHLKSVDALLQQCFHLASYETLVLTTCICDEERTNVPSAQATIKERLVTVLSRLFQTLDFKTVLCCGGETSLLALQAANAPLLAWHPQGADVRFPQFTSETGCIWVFKSGNMGEADQLSHLLQKTTRGGVS